MLNQRVLSGLSLLATLVSISVARADVPSGVMHCQVPVLKAVDGAEAEGLSLDLADSTLNPSHAIMTRDYDFPNSPVRVSIQMRYYADRIDVTKTFFKRQGSALQMMMVFVSPMSLDFPLIPNALYVLKSGEPGGSIPPFETDCQLTLPR